MIIGKTRTNQPVEGDNDALALSLAGKDIAPKDVNATGKVSGNEIIENMTGYSFVPSSNTEIECYFAGAVKNGNKVTFSIFAKITMGAENLPSLLTLGHFRIPQEIYNKLVGGFTSDAYLDIKNLYLATNYYSGASVPALMYKSNDEEKQLSVNLYNTQGLTASTEYYCRYEVTFLLSDNLVPEEPEEE